VATEKKSIWVEPEGPGGDGASAGCTGGRTGECRVFIGTAAAINLVS
jgi:hypothetical protein